MDPKAFMRFAGDVTAKEPAVSFQRNHVCFQTPLVEDFFDRVSGFVPLLSVDHFSEQAKGDELNADDNEQDTEKEEWAIAERCSSEEPFDREVAIDDNTDQERDESPDPEKVQRAANITGREEHRQKVEKSPGESADTELRVTIFSRAVLNYFLTDPETCPMGEGRDVPVELAVDADAPDDFLSIRFQTTVHVVNGNTRHEGRYAVGEPGGDGFGNRIVPSFLPPGDKIISLFERFDEGWDFSRIILKIGIHGDNDVAPSLMESDRQSGRFSEVSPEADDLDA
jgi:hypothetical protein